MPSIGLHVFPPFSMASPLPAVGYLRSYLARHAAGWKVRTAYWSQSVRRDCWGLDFDKNLAPVSFAVEEVCRTAFAYWNLRTFGQQPGGPSADELRKLAAVWYGCPDEEAAGQRMDQLCDYMDRELTAGHWAEDDIVGCSYRFWQEVPALALLRRMKAVNPRALTLVGGVTAEQASLILGAYDFVDVCVFGEGEATLAELCRRYGDGEVPSNVDGTAVRGQAGVVLNPPRACETEIDGHFADYTGFDWAVPLRAGLVPSIPIWDTRGCRWNRCRFCDFQKVQRDFRDRSPESIVRELDLHLLRVPSLKQRPFVVDLLGNDIRGSSDARFVELLERLCDYKKRKAPTLRVMGMFSPLYSSEHVMALLNELEASILWGFEQWSRILGEMRKPHRVEDNIYTFKLAAKYRLLRFANLNLLSGFPSETVSDVQETLSNLYRLRFILGETLDRWLGADFMVMPVSISTTSDLGADFDFSNPLVQQALGAHPTTKLLASLCSDDSTRDQVLALSASMESFASFDTTSTQTLTRVLVANLTAAARAASLTVERGDQGQSCLIEHGSSCPRVVPLDDTTVAILRRTAAITRVPALIDSMPSLSPDEVLGSVSALERAYLLYVNPVTQRCVNTLPDAIQERLCYPSTHLSRPLD